MKVKGTSIPWMIVEISQAMHDRDYHLKKAKKPSQKSIGQHIASSAVL